MKIYADFHIHSHYSAATSSEMVIPKIAYYAKIKGLNVVGTGDAFHPLWLRELKLTLEESPYEGLYKPLTPVDNVLFIMQSEVGTVFEFEGKKKRVHHVILMPNMDVAEQISDVLSFYGSVSSDGRPVFNMHPSELVELVLEIDDDCLIYPAHAWTPWWSIFGSFSGVNRIEDCYGDKVDKIYAIETGLSSDPEMNWRVSWIDKYALVSSSDAHSPWPFRLGREACAFNLNKLSYHEIVDAIRTKDYSRFIMTIEVEPAYGKYHWSGHRKCGFGPIPPSKAAELNYICPVCGGKLTKGVDDRVEELADRPKGFRPEGVISFLKLLPLQELIASALGINPFNTKRLYSGRVWEIYLKLIDKFKSEFNVIVNAPIVEIAKLTSDKLAYAIAKLRSGKFRVIPGFDGVYGRILLFEESSDQLKLGEFIS